MIPNFMRGTGEGGGDGNSAKESHPGMLGAGPDHLPPASAAGSADSGFPGVILWPEIKPIPTLIAPMPQTADGSFVPAMVRPLSIPFSGEYWLYRWPFARPPATSFFQRGTPSKLAFSSTDRRPIQMEAATSSINRSRSAAAAPSGSRSRTRIAFAAPSRWS